jgi:hypothetical protein
MFMLVSCAARICSGTGSNRGGYRMASSDMRELKAHIMQVCIHSASLDCCARHALSPLASLFCSVQLPRSLSSA